MVAMSSTVTLESGMSGGGGVGGFFKSIAQSALGGESLFRSTFTASGGEGNVLLSPAVPGDVSVIDLRGETYLVQSGSYLAGSPDLQVETGVGGAKGFFGGVGLFLLKITGNGRLFVSSFGAIHMLGLGAGEKMVVDTGHVVAFPSTMNYEVKKAAAGWVSSITSGEGLVCEFTGPGEIFIQTRNPQSFVSWLTPQLPKPSGN